MSFIRERLPLLLIALGVLEVVVLFLVGRAWGFGTVLLLIVLGWVIGAGLMLLAGGQAITGLRAFAARMQSGGAKSEDTVRGRPLFTATAALLFIFPGLITAAAGGLLLLPPVQRALTRKVRENTRHTNSFTAFTSGGTVMDGDIVVEVEKIPPREIER
ncbi:FxsA family protein [Dermabacteraceae bacterium P13115]|nr:FxsA family protein [Dermabacteraceae bacterium TAE3-ERU5]